jgi:hypothetical protein
LRPPKLDYPQFLIRKRVNRDILVAACWYLALMHRHAVLGERCSNQLAQYSGLSKLLASELGHPYGLNHKIPPLGETQISYSLYDAAVTPCQADRLIANYADHVKPIAIMLRWQGLLSARRFVPTGCTSTAAHTYAARKAHGVASAMGAA